MAAVLACGQGAALSHASAAALWELRRAAPARIDVTVPTAGGRADRPIRIHRAATLRAHEATVKDASPSRPPRGRSSTSPRPFRPRTSRRSQPHGVPPAGRLPRPRRPRPSPSRPPRSAQAPRDARPLRRRSEPHPQRPRDPLPADLQGPRTPGAAVNTTVEGKEVDFLFRAQRLIVEADSLALPPHPSRVRGRPRGDVLTTRAGYRTLRFTDRQLTDAPHSVAAAIRATLCS